MTEQFRQFIKSPEGHNVDEFLQALKAVHKDWHRGIGVEDPGSKKDVSRKETVFVHRVLTFYPERGGLVVMNDDGREVRLTKTEVRLLTVMVTKTPGTVASSSELSKALRRGIEGDIDLVKWHIYRMRQKLGPDIIVSVRGFGYKFSADEPVSGAS